MEHNDWDDEPYDDDLPDECDHDDYEVDILSGRAECSRCPHTWYLTIDDVEREIDRIREYDAWQVEQYRRDELSEHWWGRAWLWLTDAIRRPAEM